jgi:hypothetical protein
MDSRSIAARRRVMRCGGCGVWRIAGMKRKGHICPNAYHGSGARGGCYFEIREGESSEEMAQLNVGHSCVVVYQKEIPISWLAEIIAIASSHKNGIAGFLKEHENDYGAESSYALMCDPAP